MRPVNAIASFTARSTAGVIVSLSKAATADEDDDDDDEDDEESSSKRDLATSRSMTTACRSEERAEDG